MAKDATQVSNSSQQRATSEPPDRPTGPLAIPVPAGERDEVKVNNANLSELKNACDDTLKRVRLSNFPPYTRSNWLTGTYVNSCSGTRLGSLMTWGFRHDTIVSLTSGVVQTNSYTYRCTTRAGLGGCACCCWDGVLRLQDRIWTIETGCLGWRHFVSHITICSSCSYLISWVRYVILTTIQTLYAYFIEGDTVFMGRRKTFSKRVSGASYLSRELELSTIPTRWTNYPPCADNHRTYHHLRQNTTRNKSNQN